jgi:lipopolysaccharide/colanic/teichoic acid biosynthesis glycosyltransferase
MTDIDKNIKRGFDVFFSIFGLLLFGWLILLLALVSKVFIKGNGFFKQKRVGQFGELFILYKIETIHPKEVKQENQLITKIGQSIRKLKIDEFPQLWNVLEGKMSFVGPRPDVPGYADKLEGEERIILSVKPGITGPATLYFRQEEELLKNQGNAEKYNREIIWPQKVLMNIKYVKEHSFLKDLYYICKTLFL